MEFFYTKLQWAETGLTFSLFGIEHIIAIVLMAIAVVLLAIFRKKLNHKYIRIYLMVSAVFWAALEVVKIVLYFTVPGNTMQALREVLPLYLCSLFLFMLPLAAFTKGFVKKLSDYTLATLCIFTGLVTTINCPALSNYPFFSFYGLHSLLYHIAMTLTGVLLLVSDYVKFELKSFYLPLIPVAVLCIPAIIVNNLVNTDYMMLRYAWGAPIIQDVAKIVGQVPQIFIMLAVYALITFLMTLLGVGIGKLSKLGIKRKAIQAGAPAEGDSAPAAAETGKDGV